MSTLEQATFDIDAMLAEVNPAPPLPPYTGRAPLHFTVDYFEPAEFAEAWERWLLENNNPIGSLRLSHMWTSAATLGHANALTAGHDLYIVDADLRCDHNIHCGCPGDLLYQAIDVECRWHSFGTEKEVVEAWHDHAWAGWRELPVMPANVRGVGGITKKDKAAIEWLADNYTTPWHAAGAPILTERSPMASRHVPSYSPTGGFDLAAVDRLAAA